MGGEATCYAENTDYDFDKVRPVANLNKDLKQDDIILFHFSTFDPALEVILKFSNKKYCYAHNITDPSFFKHWNPSDYDNVKRGYEQFSMLGNFDGLAANSAFTAGIIEAYGGSFDVSAIAVIPPTSDIRKWQSTPPIPIETALPSDVPLVLYVGRRAPNKRIDRVLRVMALLQKQLPTIHFAFVGKAVVDSYEDEVRSVIETSGSAKNNWHVFNEVSAGQLKWLYERATAFITLSEHEGFCVPVADALYFDLPVFAYDQAAVRELCIRSEGVFHLTNAVSDSEVSHELQTFLRKENNMRLPYVSNSAKNIEKYCNSSALDAWLARITKLVPRRTAK
jgi:glycosyltransferase involved in cell wall biosynthesis